MIERPLPGERRGERGGLGRMPREVNTVRTFIFLSFLFKKEVDHSEIFISKAKTFNMAQVLIVLLFLEKGWFEITV